MLRSRRRSREAELERRMQDEEEGRPGLSEVEAQQEVEVLLVPILHLPR